MNYTAKVLAVLTILAAAAITLVHWERVSDDVDVSGEESSPRRESPMTWQATQQSALLYLPESH